MVMQVSPARVSVGFQSRERPKFFGLSLLWKSTETLAAQATVRISHWWRNKVSWITSKSPSDKCRVCECDFKTKFGTVGDTAQAIREFKFIPLKGSECRCTVLAETCRTAGIEVEQNPVNYSCRVCNKRARKIRNIGKLYRKHQWVFSPALENWSLHILQLFFLGKLATFECERCYASIITLYAAPIRSTDFSVDWRTGFFKITIFAGKRFLSLLPPTPFFVLYFLPPSPLAPFFTRSHFLRVKIIKISFFGLSLLWKIDARWVLYQTPFFDWKKYLPRLSV